MFGTLRLILAFMVALTHGGYYSVFDINPGHVAVVCFYIISGFVMTGLVRSYYWDKKTIFFYLDRGMRIYPQYLFFIFLTITMFWISGDGLIFKEANQKYLYNHTWWSWPDIFYNVTIVALNVVNIDKWIVPAWTIGLEIQFYIILPYILRRFKPYFLLYSVFLFSLASFNIINGNIFGYTLLFGTLFIFLSGSLLYDYINGNKTIWKYIVGLYVYICILFIGKKSIGSYNFVDDSIVKSVFIGYLVGMPVIFLLSLFKRRKLDEFLGNISYGVYLSHMFLIWFSRHYVIFEPKDNILLFLTCSIILGLTGYYLVERPVALLRKRIRQRQCSQAK